MTKKITTFFTDAGTPKTGLSATIRIRDGSGTLVVTDAAMTEIGDGFYGYDFTTYDIEEEYSIRCDGSATLTNNSDRYTYAGNESYNDDIWDTETLDHDIAGTMGYEIRGSGGVVVGTGNNSRGLTLEEAEAIAKKVWAMILSNNKSAAEILITRSDFNAIKDEVTLSKKSVVDYSKEMALLFTEVQKISNEVSILCAKPDPVVDVPESLADSINELVSGVNDILPGITNAAEVINTTSDSISEKVDSLQAQMAGTNLDLSKANELAEAFTTLKDSLTVLMQMTERMSGDTVQRRMLKKAMLQLNDIKFMNLRR